MSGKAVPTRMCMICRGRFPKTQLLRHVLPPPEEVEEQGHGRIALVADTAQVGPGRGWYLCSDPECREKFSKAGRVRRKRKGVDRNG